MGVLMALSAEHVAPRPATATAKLPTSRLASGPDVDMVDMDTLLSAVKARLCLCVGTPPETDLAAHPDAARRVQVSVLECVAALDQLQATLRNELARCHHLELAVLDANSALAQARAELAGTQADEH